MFSNTIYLNAIENTSLIRKVGQVTQFFGLIVEADGPDVFLGERCEIYSRPGEMPIDAEVIGVRENRVILMPYGDIRGVRFGSEVIGTGRAVEVNVGGELLGRVVDSFGKPLDGKDPIESNVTYPAFGTGVNPLMREPIQRRLSTGIKAVDTMLPIGEGQRVGLFAGSGVGKSTLLSMVARNLDSDINVIALIGERGREVEEFIRVNLGEEGLAKSVLVVETSDRSALQRYHAAHTATAIAEYFCDQGKSVTLLMDSVTRYAMALREIGLSVGEPPTARGYTPSVFSALPRLLERCGNFSGKGSITAIYTVLVDGDDLNDPIADAVRATLDGHVVLTRLLAERAHFPAIDILKSVSRLSSQLLNDTQQGLQRKLQRWISIYEQSRDLIEVGAYKVGLNSELDTVVERWGSIENFLMQKSWENYDLSDSENKLADTINERS